MNMEWEPPYEGIYLHPGLHDEKGQYIELNYSINIIGQNMDDCIVYGGFLIHGTYKSKYGERCSRKM